MAVAGGSLVAVGQWLTPDVGMQWFLRVTGVDSVKDAVLAKKLSGVLVGKVTFGMEQLQKLGLDDDFGHCSLLLEAVQLARVQGVAPDPDVRRSTPRGNAASAVEFPAFGSTLKNYRVTSADRAVSSGESFVIQAETDDEQRTPAAIKCFTTGPEHPDGRRSGEHEADCLRAVKGGASVL